MLDLKTTNKKTKDIMVTRHQYYILSCLFLEKHKIICESLYNFKCVKWMKRAYLKTRKTKDIMVTNIIFYVVIFF